MWERHSAGSRLVCHLPPDVAAETAGPQVTRSKAAFMCTRQNCSVTPKASTSACPCTEGCARSVCCRPAYTLRTVAARGLARLGLKADVSRACRAPSVPFADHLHGPFTLYITKGGHEEPAEAAELPGRPGPALDPAACEHCALCHSVRHGWPLSACCHPVTRSYYRN